jgi:hypothetical protein
MHYTTVLVGIVEGHEAQGINDAIEQGLKELSEEVKGPVELVNVVPVPIPNLLCMIVFAKPYQHANVGIFDAMRALNWGSETCKGTQAKQLL